MFLNRAFRLRQAAASSNLLVPRPGPARAGFAPRTTRLGEVTRRSLGMARIRACNEGPWGYIVADSIQVIGIGGSLRAASTSRTALEVALQGAETLEHAPP
jgi:hypothetical protein